MEPTINPPRSHKNIFITLAALIGILIIILILSRTKPNTNVENVSIPSPIPTSLPIIVSPEITNNSQPNNADQYWASMYRPDLRSNKIYFVIDRQKNLLQEVMGADAETFQVLASSDGSTFSYARDARGIYCNQNLHLEISSSTFTYNRWSALYAKDAQHVYLNCEVLPGAHQESFEALDTQGSDSLYAKDTERVYFNGIPLTEADPKTFVLLGDSYSQDTRHLYFKENLVGSTDYKITTSSNGEIVLVSHTKLISIFKSTDSLGGVIRPIETASYEGADKLVVYKNKIYFIDPNGSLRAFDPSTNTSSIIELKGLKLIDNGAPRIMDFFVSDHSMYFLYGDNCNSYRAKCDVALMKDDMETSALTTIASHLNARDILNINKNTNTMYILWADGDAGCGWAYMTTINISSGSIIKGNDLSACDSDANFKTVTQQMNHPDTSIPEPKATSSIYIQNGKIIPAPLTQGETTSHIVYLPD